MPSSQRVPFASEVQLEGRVVVDVVEGKVVVVDVRVVVDSVDDEVDSDVEGSVDVTVDVGVVDRGSVVVSGVVVGVVVDSDAAHSELTASSTSSTARAHPPMTNQVHAKTPCSHWPAQQGGGKAQQHEIASQLTGMLCESDKCKLGSKNGGNWCTYVSTPPTKNEPEDLPQYVCRLAQDAAEFSAVDPSPPMLAPFRQYINAALDALGCALVLSMNAVPALTRKYFCSTAHDADARAGVSPSPPRSLVPSHTKGATLPSDRRKVYVPLPLSMSPLAAMAAQVVAGLREEPRGAR